MFRGCSDYWSMGLHSSLINVCGCGGLTVQRQRAAARSRQLQNAPRPQRPGGRHASSLCRGQWQVDLNLAGGEAAATVLGTDLTHEYVSINGDYRS